MGTAAACVLLLLKPLVIHHVLDLEPRVLAVVAAYWTVRAAAVPLAMTNMACTGVLQVGGRGPRVRSNWWMAGDVRR